MSDFKLLKLPEEIVNRVEKKCVIAHCYAIDTSHVKIVKYGKVFKTHEF